MVRSWGRPHLNVHMMEINNKRNGKKLESNFYFIPFHIKIRIIKKEIKERN